MGDFRIGTKAVFTQSGSDEPVLASTVTGVSLYSSIAVICEQQTADTQGGTFTSGAWRTRTLNHEITDADSIVTLSSNQFTLINGTYTIEWLAPALRCGRHVSKLVETQTPTDAGIAQAMMVNVNDSNSSSPSHGFAVVQYHQDQIMYLKYNINVRIQEILMGWGIILDMLLSVILK